MTTSPPAAAAYSPGAWASFHERPFGQDADPQFHPLQQRPLVSLGIGGLHAAVTAAPYYGFGCSAHSYDGLSRRWQNEREVVRYMETIEDCRSPIVEETRLTKADREAEAVFLGLRMMQGFSFAEYRRLFGADLREKHENDLARFREAGLIECSGEVLKLTRAGALLSNEVFAAFV